MFQNLLNYEKLCLLTHGSFQFKKKNTKKLKNRNDLKLNGSVIRVKIPKLICYFIQQIHK